MLPVFHERWTVHTIVLRYRPFDHRWHSPDEEPSTAYSTTARVGWEPVTIIAFRASRALDYTCEHDARRHSAIGCSVVETNRMSRRTVVRADRR